MSKLHDLHVMTSSVSLKSVCTLLVSLTDPTIQIRLPNPLLKRSCNIFDSQVMIVTIFDILIDLKVMTSSLSFKLVVT